MGIKVGRNDKCLCGSMKKYKHCCLPKGINFENMSLSQMASSMNIHAKNMLFIYKMLDILEIDSFVSKGKTTGDLIIHLRKILNPQKIRKIHELIPVLWPDEEDYYRCINCEDDKPKGIFIGHYIFDSTVSMMNRYGLYEENIILIDPFVDHRILREDVNPVAEPSQFKHDTLNNVLLWFQLLPWINAGLVKLIRDPFDFDINKARESRDVSIKRYKECKELADLEKYGLIPDSLKDYASKIQLWSLPESNSLQKQRFLSFWKSQNIDPKNAIDAIMSEREKSPFYLPISDADQIIRLTSGTNYETGKYICSIMNGHILTDLKARWVEMEYDRKCNNVTVNKWSLISKEFQQVDLPFLNGLKIDDIFKLRNDGYLEHMRDFLKKLWLMSNPDSSIEKRSVELMCLELKDEIAKANDEWKKIDRVLCSSVLKDSVLSTLPLLTGQPFWVSGICIAASSAFELAKSTNERKNFIKRYPAGFFIEEIRR